MSFGIGMNFQFPSPWLCCRNLSYAPPTQHQVCSKIRQLCSLMSWGLAVYSKQTKIKQSPQILRISSWEFPKIVFNDWILLLDKTVIWGVAAVWIFVWPSVPSHTNKQIFSNALDTVYLNEITHYCSSSKVRVACWKRIILRSWYIVRQSSHHVLPDTELEIYHVTTEISHKV